MKKSKYRADTAVNAFSEWLAKHLSDGTFATSYLDRDTKSKKTFKSLFDAYDNYCWQYSAIPGLAHPPGTYNFNANLEALKHLRKKLFCALDPLKGSDTAMRDSAIDVMTWGGVRPGNVMWLNNNYKGLKNLVQDVRGVLNLQDTAKIPTGNLRFNSGMTKVYSLICEDFIIYDSRVAAALGWAVTKFCQEKGHATVPEELKFPWAPAKESPNQKNPKRRDPSIDKLRFPRLSPGRKHATWNLKASWLLNYTLECADPDEDFKRAENPLRALEAALFMIGYDLPKPGTRTSLVTETTEYAPPPKNAPATDSPIPDGDWIDSETLRKRVTFRYRLQNDRIEVSAKRTMFFPIEVMEQTLMNLWKDFENKPFPLSNSATDVRNGTAKLGLGTAYYLATGKKGNPPDASFLAAVLIEAMDAIIPTESASSAALHWTLNAEKLGLGKPKSAVRAIFERSLNELGAN